MGGGQYENPPTPLKPLTFISLTEANIRESNLKESLRPFVGDSQKQKARGSLNHWIGQDTNGLPTQLKHLQGLIA